MDLTPKEKRVVRRAVQAYRDKKESKGRYTGATPDQILEELDPSPARWTHLAALVIATVEAVSYTHLTLPTILLV